MSILALIPLFPLASAALLMLSTGRMPRRLAAFLGTGSVGLSAACVALLARDFLDDGQVREEFQLNSPGHAVYLPPMVWGIQYKYSEDAVLLVLASEKYSADDYIRNYDEFRREKGLQ